jgi:hypothetical protein
MALDSLTTRAHSRTADDRLSTGLDLGGDAVANESGPRGRWRLRPPSASSRQPRLRGAPGRLGGDGGHQETSFYVYRIRTKVLDCRLAASHGFLSGKLGSFASFWSGTRVPGVRTR